METALSTANPRFFRVPRRDFVTSVALLAALVGFWLYSVGRTLSETVGVTFQGTLGGLLFGAVLPLMITIPPLLTAWKFWSAPKTWIFPILRATGISLLMGCLVAECWILWDEARFYAETARSSLNVPYSRDRTWPNEGCSLVYIPGKDIHATD